MSDDHRRRRIIEIASTIVGQRIERGEIAGTDEAIRAAMPEAIDLARSAYDAAMEYIS